MEYRNWLFFLNLQEVHLEMLQLLFLLIIIYNFFNIRLSHYPQIPDDLLLRKPVAFPLAENKLGLSLEGMNQMLNIFHQKSIIYY